MIIVTIFYYAALREQRGLRSERVETDATNARELYESLMESGGLKVDARLVRVAINDEMGELNRPISNGDKVVFIPPVAGG